MREARVQAAEKMTDWHGNMGWKRRCSVTFVTSWSSIGIMAASANRNPDRGCRGVRPLEPSSAVDPFGATRLLAGTRRGVLP